ncbi:MAG TPA: cell division protein ZapA [Bacteroidia bacterium]|nr:cell division protein ZapA [Bacteroidia bacterium]
MKDLDRNQKEPAAKAVNPKDKMGEKSVKITIAGRAYPLKVNASEEAFVNDAARRINERLIQLESKYSVKDKQDLLAMTALQFATQYLEAQQKISDENTALLSGLAAIETMLDAHISKPGAVS